MDDRKRRQTEFGDFQTPLATAQAVCSLIQRSGFRPAAVLEPTCGKGAFLQAALEHFPHICRIVGFDLNPHYVHQARQTLSNLFPDKNVEISQGDFFRINWTEVVEELPEPILILGNPPWVTNADLGVLESRNLPKKANHDRLPGMAAITGKSNFDISEWMLRKNIDWLSAKRGMLAVLCKVSVARKVLLYAWEKNIPITSACVYRLEAEKIFGVTVEACLLVIQTGSAAHGKECSVYPSLDAPRPECVFGFRDGMLIADLRLYEKWKHLRGTPPRRWRSGVKHDCAKVFELRPTKPGLVNGLGEPVDVEPEYIFPLLKSSDLVKQQEPHRWLILPQKTMGEDTARLQTEAPRMWQYLLAQARFLDRRKSSIYKNRPRFSIFGVGPYSFTPWKVAISGLYKTLRFVLVGPFQDRPVIFDDTCYFFPCESEEESRLVYEIVCSEPAQEFWKAFIFWDAKRPITADLLNLLDLNVASEVLGKKKQLRIRKERLLWECATSSPR